MQKALPKGWKMVKLGEVVRVDKGKKLELLNSYIEESTPYVGIDNLRTNQYSSFTIKTTGLACVETDLLIAWDGANAGTVGYGLKGYVGSTIARLRPSGESITKYLGFILKSKFQQFNIQTHGAAIPHLSKTHILKTLLPLPPLPIQHKIVKILEEADNLRKLRQQADEKMKDLIPSLFGEMFGDPVVSERNWPKYKLSDLCQAKHGIKAGPFGSSLKKEIYTKSGFRIYGQEQVIAGDFNLGDYYISKEKFESMRAYEVKPNDLLISLVGTIGKVIIVPENIEPGIINPRLLKISPKLNMLNSLFLMELLQHPSIQHSLNQVAHGGTMGVLNAGLLKKLSVQTPPLTLQQEFAKLVKDIEEENARQAESKKKLDDLFNSLMQRAFTGELTA